MKQLETFSAGLTTLAWLDIGDEGVKRLAPLTQLKHLRLNNTTIKDPKCFEALVNLESLDLGDAYVLDYSLAPLANMKKLKRLNLLGTLVTDDGLKYLRDLTDMEDLDLYGVKITDAGVEHLRKMTGLAPPQPAGRADHGCQRGDSLAVPRTARPEPVPQQDHRRRAGQTAIAQEAGDARPALQRRDQCRRAGVPGRRARLQGHLRGCGSADLDFEEPAPPAGAGEPAIAAVAASRSAARCRWLAEEFNRSPWRGWRSTMPS